MLSPKIMKEGSRTDIPNILLVAFAGIGTAVLVTSNAPLIIRVALLVLSVPFIAFAWGLHLLPGHNRTLKYVAFSIGAAATSGIHFITKPVPIAMTVGLFLVLSVGSVILLIYFRENNPKAGEKRFAFWYRQITWVQGSDLPSVLFLTLLNILEFSPIYVLIRFIVKGRMTRRPIVYLRSFGQSAAPSVFSNIILPGVGRYGVVTGLVGVKQTSDILQKSASAFWRTNLQIVPDIHWKNWVSQKLNDATGAIIDISKLTEAVMWELNHALEVLGADRILVLHSGGDDKVEMIEKLGLKWHYAHYAGTVDFHETVKYLAWWADTLTSSSVPDSRKTKIVIGKKRKQLPVLFYVYFEWCVLLLMLITGVAMYSVSKLRVSEEAESRQAEMNIRSASMLYLAQRAGRCPSVEQLVAEHYLVSNTLLEDPWGQPFEIKCTPEDIYVISSGPDKKKDTDDDIVEPNFRDIF